MWSPSHVASPSVCISFTYSTIRELFLPFHISLGIHHNPACHHHGYQRNPLHHQPHNNLLPQRDPRHPPSSLQRLSHLPPTAHNAPQNPPTLHLARLRRPNPFHSRRLLSLQLLLQLHHHQLRHRPRTCSNKQISPSRNLFPQRPQPNLRFRIRHESLRCFMARIRTRRPSVGR